MDELKPCPFCGGKPTLMFNSVVECRHCPAGKYSGYPSADITAWNTRAASGGDSASLGKRSDGMLPDELVQHSKEWYRLCERRFSVERMTISGELAEAIVTCISRLNEPFGNPEQLALNEPSGDSGQLASQEQRALRCMDCKGAGEVMLPVWTPDPQDGYERLGTCPKCGGNGGKVPAALESLLYFTEHCLSAADEGVDYSTTREWLDAMTTMGIMEKTGRGKWAPSAQAQPVVDALRAITAAIANQQGVGDQ